MKYQVLFSLKSNKKYKRLSSAAVVIGALRVKNTSYSLSLSLTGGFYNMLQYNFIGNTKIIPGFATGCEFLSIQL